ncbi:MAG: ABC transporter ATP-binding protein [Thermoanaerobacteraceae bacterium]|nr:ABC transporter ATP-binding protein [Thermoanaerobacteraceae bacterium]
MECFLEIKELCKSFVSNGRYITVLDKISFNLHENDFLCVLGPSGCGKSTLLRCIAGYEKINSGKIILEGNELTKPGTDRMMVFQDFNQLFPWLTVEKNIDYPLKINYPKLSKIQRKELTSYYLELVNLDNFKDFYPHQLSGGMKQRVVIVRALSLHPKLLLMDEPFGSLDALTRYKLQKELLKIYEHTGVTIIFVTHNIDEAIILSSKIVVLSQHPAKIIDIITNDIEQPRLPGTPQYGELWNRLNLLMGLDKSIEESAALTREEVI